MNTNFHTCVFSQFLKMVCSLRGCQFRRVLREQNKELKWNNKRSLCKSKFLYLEYFRVYKYLKDRNNNVRICTNNLRFKNILTSQIMQLIVSPTATRRPWDNRRNATLTCGRDFLSGYSCGFFVKLCIICPCLNEK